MRESQPTTNAVPSNTIITQSKRCQYRDEIRKSEGASRQQNIQEVNGKEGVHRKRAIKNAGHNARRY